MPPGASAASTPPDERVAALAGSDATTTLDARTIDIWSADQDLMEGDRLWDACRGLLSAEERAQSGRFVFERDRRRYIATRALVRTSLSRYQPIDPREWKFGANRYGRPHIEHPASPLTFNVSHSHRMIAIAICRQREVGLDLENTRTRDAPLELAERVFTAHENAALRQLPAVERSARFWEYWTLKEAYVKARGCGLSLSPDLIEFRYPRKGKLSLRARPGVEAEGRRWWLWQCRPAPDYVAALCLERRSEPRPVVKWQAGTPLGRALPSSMEMMRVSAL